MLNLNVFFAFTSVNQDIDTLIFQESKLKAARMHIYVRRGGPNYQRGLTKMRSLGEEIGIPIEVPIFVKLSSPVLSCIQLTANCQA